MDAPHCLPQRAVLRAKPTILTCWRRAVGSSRYGPVACQSPRDHPPLRSAADDHSTSITHGSSAAIRRELLLLQPVPGPGSRAAVRWPGVQPAVGACSASRATRCWAASSPLPTWCSLAHAVLGRRRSGRAPPVWSAWPLVTSIAARWPSMPCPARPPASPMMLLFNVGAAALLLPLRLGIGARGLRHRWLLTGEFLVRTLSASRRPIVQSPSCMMFASATGHRHALPTWLGPRRCAPARHWPNSAACEAGQPGRDQRTDHPAHAHRRAAGRWRRPHQTGQRGRFAADRRRQRRRDEPGHLWRRSRPNWRGACDQLAQRRQNDRNARCSSPRTCPKCMPRFARLLAGRRRMCWCSWTTPRWCRGAPNR